MSVSAPFWEFGGCHFDGHGGDEQARLAKHGAITFKDGKVQQGNYDDFPVIRIDESPAVTNVYIVPPGPDTPPSGVGEPGLPPFAPALINAIFAATGKRIRALPIGKQLET